MAAGALANNGGGQPHNNMQPFLTVSYIIALQGEWPSPG
jgi:microcystin-dependent protein